jgi:dipeptidyl aminopeptidase/acylaminoacyl peptidase
MKVLSLLFSVLFILSGFFCVQAQKLNLEQVIGALEKNDCLAVGKGVVKICKFDYKFGNQTVEAITMRPADGEKFPSLLLAPGYDLTAKDLIPLGVMFAHEGFASVAVTPPGFGKTEGKADFVGENTLDIFIEGWKKFRQKDFIDKERMAIYGHSRGGMAASLLATRLPEAKAAVMASGIYDFRLAFEEISLKGIRDLMIAETGATEKAFKDRSSILEMEKLKIPVLILHGEKDEKTPVKQAYLLRDKLTELKKDFEIKIYPELGHELVVKEVIAVSSNFLKRRLNIN